MGLYQDFRERLGQGLREHNIDSTHGLHVSVDTNQAGTTMTSRHEVSKQGLSIALVPGAGKIGWTVGKAVFGFSRPQSVLKVIWPLLLFDDPPPIMIKYMEAKLKQQEKSPGQDMTLPGPPGRQIPKTPGGTKSSRAAGAAQTLKPFWSNGKPKCRKGYRYDFKRKMCVKKS
ncbi:MAG: hypothetical protein [Circular genetic element sp.]|nr:MAG: hypothetical protein [Circular genetic element sp.]MDC0465122.1 hypothetical protein [Pseudomonadales bacterium]